MSHLSGRCDCGRVMHFSKNASYGDTWTCYKCGKTWHIAHHGDPLHYCRSKAPADEGYSSGTGCLLPIILVGAALVIAGCVLSQRFFNTAINFRSNNMGKNTQQKDERFVATVRLVRPEGVYVETPSAWAGSISPKCWGKGEERAKAMAKIMPGDKLNVRVVARFPQTKSMSLVLAAGSSVVSVPAKKRKDPKSRTRAEKPTFVPFPVGTHFLIDLSNLIGELEGRNCVEWIRAIECFLSNAGYGVTFFVEHRTLCYAAHQQNSVEEGHLLMKLCDRKDIVTVVYGHEDEADLAIMQTASAMPNSICVSCDRYRDYEEAYPDIVGTPRVRSFSITRMGGKEILTIMGLRDPIVLTAQDAPRPLPMSGVMLNAPHRGYSAPMEDAGDSSGKEKTSGAPLELVKPESKTAFPHGIVKAKERGCDSQAESTDNFPRTGRMAQERDFRRHSRETSIRLGLQLARKKPEGYYALSDIYADGDEAEQKLSAKYDDLGHKLEKRLREEKYRALRLHAQMRRTGAKSRGHFSAKKCG